MRRKTLFYNGDAGDVSSCNLLPNPKELPVGRSPSIQDLENQEDAYRAYLKKLEQELSTRAQSSQADLDARVKAYYATNKYDSVDFISGKNSDFMQKADWSLANVKTIIDAISDAIFGGGSPPSGVGIKKTAQTDAAIAEMADLEVYVAAKCFEVLSGIIESFGSASSVSFSENYKNEPLGNGLHLFAKVVCDSYKSTDFFNNEEIYEYLYIYYVKYSVEEAKTQAKIEVTKLYENQIATFVKKVDDLLSQLTDGTITPEQYQSSADMFQKLIDASRQKLDELKATAR